MTAASSRPAAAETIPTPEEIADEAVTAALIALLKAGHIDCAAPGGQFSDEQKAWVRLALNAAYPSIAAALRAAEDRGAKERWLPIAGFPERLIGKRVLLWVAYLDTPTAVTGKRYDDGAWYYDPGYRITMPVTHYHEISPPAQAGGSETQP